MRKITNTFQIGLYMFLFAWVDFVWAGGGDQTLVVNSTLDESDVTLDGNCSTVPDGSVNRCTLRAAIQEANIFPRKTIIEFDINDAGCINDICSITVDRANNGSLPDIIGQVEIDGSTQPDNSTVCTLSPEMRPSYKVVVQGDSMDIGLRLESGSEGSVIRGLNVRNFLNNIAIINSSDNRVECNLIGTDETGLLGTGQNPANGIIVGCEANNNILGGPNAEDGNVIANQDVDGIQYFAGFTCPTGTNIPSNNAILGNYIGIAKDGITPLGNTFGGISFWGGPTFGHYVGTLQDGTTTHANLINNSISGIYIDDGSNNITIKGNHIGTDLTGTLNLGNTAGGVDIVSGSNNIVGGTLPGESNLIAFNSEGVLISGASSSGNLNRGNQYLNNQNNPIDLIQDGGIDPDGSNPNDADDVDDGANKLINYPDITGVTLVDSGGDILVEADVFVDATSINAAYPLVIDMYYEEETNSGIQNSLYVSSVSYDMPQNVSNEIFDLPDGVIGGYLRFTVTDDEGNTSEMSPSIAFGFIDLIFKNDFE